ncbi:MAG: chemotaxis protein CheW [Nitrospiraceae bacterium]|nr:MAG: chemotaxis protein CheW [Nitrospiraceae bacterium]
MEHTMVNDQVLQLVTFTLEKEEYAVNILNVQEINRINEITRVPNAPDYVEGVINLRGKVIPVINLRKKFGLYNKETDESSRVIIMDIMGVTYGLIVDSVSEVLRIPSDIVEPPPPMASSMTSMYIKGIAKLENRLIIFVDIDKLLGQLE